MCLLAAQWVWTRPPSGHRANAGSQKGLWHFWHNFLSESRIELPSNLICENKHNSHMLLTVPRVDAPYPIDHYY